MAKYEIEIPDAAHELIKGRAGGTASNVIESGLAALNVLYQYDRSYRGKNFEAMTVEELTEVAVLFRTCGQLLQNESGVHRQFVDVATRDRRTASRKQAWANRSDRAESTEPAEPKTPAKAQQSFLRVIDGGALTRR